MTRLWRSASGADERLDAIGVGVGPEALCGLARRSAHRLAAPEHVDHRGGQRSRLAGLDQHSRHAVVDDLGGGRHTRVATTGVPTAIASLSTVPNGSW